MIIIIIIYRVDDQRGKDVPWIIVATYYYIYVLKCPLFEYKYLVKQIFVFKYCSKDISY